ncbi:16S rRNA (guanine(966)-N(2))-methyltransferase RsmD [Coralliovum pocilloporae]|uniref:16S rRNA (guanine(966)-N(2))-methyltransferase RsmD n=1 Tax=Coralliovum pocilloporae TaxID=3066369 RepID=UPI003307C2A5
MRVVGGKFRGKALAGPKTDAIRPTTDRMRESVFNILEHRFGGLEGRRVLDLFAGTGALGLEAMSRGAEHALFVEEGVEGRGLLRRNIESLGLMGRTRIFRRDATKLGEVGTLEPFDLVFLDPPYSRGLGEQALVSAAGGGWLKASALCVFEEAAGAEVAIPDEFSLEDERKAGDSVVRYLAYTG